MESKQLRKTIQHSVEVHAAAKDIWPLLCPVREYDWIEGWEAELIHSESGYNEQDCMFRTRTAEGTSIDWITSRYEPETFHLEFVRFHEDGFVSRYRINLVPLTDATTRMELFMVMTGLSTKNHESFPYDYLEKMRYWSTYMGAALEHYLHSGTILEEKLFPIN